MKKIERALYIGLVLTFIVVGRVIASDAPRVSLGDLRTLGGWTGVERAAGQGAGGGDCASLAASGEAVFVYPAGPKGWYKRGFRAENDGTADWRDFYGIQFDVKLTDDRPAQLTAQIRLPDQPVRLDYVTETNATVELAGVGWHRVTLPWAQFDFQQAQPAFLKFVRELHLKSSAPILVDNVRLVRAASVALQCAIRGKSALAGKREGEALAEPSPAPDSGSAGASPSPDRTTVEYNVTVSNCTGQPQMISLSMQKHGWEAMDAIVEPASVQLASDESKPVTVRVRISSRVPPGGHEQQTLRAVANGDASTASTLTFTTASELPHPNILHTADAWAEIRQHVKQYDWAKRDQEEFVSRAEQWSVPEVAPPGKNTTFDDMGPFLFSTQNENGLMACAISYQLTGDKKFAQKVATFLLNLSDPSNGYPTTFRGCNQSLVQEGHFFQHIAMSYDMVLDSGLLSPEQREQIDNTLRIYIETIRLELQTGHIGNWNVSEYVGALYCALAMEDLSLADEFLNSPSGIIDQLEKGTMDDGWWYECSISYNTWVAAEFSQVAIAMRPWGMNLADQWFPASYTRNYSVIPWAMQPGQYGMSFDKFGPVNHDWTNIKRMWDALPVFADFGGTMFGVNDSTERPLAGTRTEVGGQPFEIAYYLYRDPAYAAIIKRGRGRDLLYAVPELPENAPNVSSQSAYADNVGVVMLRSQTPDRPQIDRIQAVLHYGTHGGYHGHFDRTNLLSLMRYGRSFYNPEMIWYSYEPYMYKFYVQSSINKNMVVVDQLMQEPVESDRLLFHTGKMMQATAVQTNARWSHEPFGGMVYDWFHGTLADKQWSEGRSFPIPTDAPKYGDIGPYSDRVLQRRLMIVTDDYVVLADYLKGEREHTFDSLMQVRGFAGLDAANKKLLRHDGQWNADPRYAAQFVTDCDWYEVAAPARARFNDPAFNMDVISLWPKGQQIMIGTAPENQQNEKQLWYTVRGDGKTLAEGKFGAWILGKADIDVPVDGVKELELETKVEKSKQPTLFWGDARLVTRDGKKIPLDHLTVQSDNVLQPAQKGRDYFGGPIKLLGVASEHAIPAEPKAQGKPGVIRIDLSSTDAVRLNATLAGDYPLGDETGLRKTYSVRTRGTEAQFLTLIEPHAGESVIKSAQAIGPDQLKVDLADGRTQIITIANLTGGGDDIQVSMTESKDGKEIRAESTQEK